MGEAMKVIYYIFINLPLEIEDTPANKEVNVNNNLQIASQSWNLPIKMHKASLPKV